MVGEVGRGRLRFVRTTSSESQESGAQRLHSLHGRPIFPPFLETQSVMLSRQSCPDRPGAPDGILTPARGCGSGNKWLFCGESCLPPASPPSLNQPAYPEPSTTTLLVPTTCPFSPARSSSDPGRPLSSSLFASRRSDRSSPAAGSTPPSPRRRPPTSSRAQRRSRRSSRTPRPGSCLRRCECSSRRKVS